MNCSQLIGTAVLFVNDILLKTISLAYTNAYSGTTIYIAYPQILLLNIGGVKQALQREQSDLAVYAYCSASFEYHILISFSIMTSIVFKYSFM